MVGLVAIDVTAADCNLCRVEIQILVVYTNNNNNNNINNSRTMFMVLSSWLISLVIARVHPVHAMNAEQRQTATDLWSKPTDLTEGS